MLFNSFEFLIFLPFVFLCYWYLFSKNKLTQNLFLLFASYIFYAFWDIRFLILLIFSGVLDFYLGKIIDKHEDEGKRKWFLRISVFTKVLILGYFKYTNFFINTFNDLANHFGYKTSSIDVNIIIPIGISFYTFHGISYLVDIYYKRIKPNNDIVEYNLFVAYFPLLVAGPIERATHLLPQLGKKRNFNYNQSISGLRLILWGMFKKVVVADSLSNIVYQVFLNYSHLNAISLITGVVSLSFLIYGDFSGYSDIARGVSRLFGIELIKNFNFPYFSKSIGEYWSRWHISLSSWLNDYVFTPLAIQYRNWGKIGVYLAVFLTFLISGFWHGAAWHYVAQGVLFSIFYIPVVFSTKKVKFVQKLGSTTFSIVDVLKMFRTYVLVCIGYIYFRADSLGQASGYIVKLFSSIIKKPADLFSLPVGWECIIYIAPVVIAELIFLKYGSMQKVPKFLKYFAYLILGIMIFFCIDKKTSFVYFQF